MESYAVKTNSLKARMPVKLMEKQGLADWVYVLTLAACIF